LPRPIKDRRQYCGFFNNFSLEIFMKRIITVIFFIITISCINAENIIDVYWNIGNMGLGMNYLSKEDDNIEFTVSIFNLTFEHKYTNIGIEFNPIKYWHLFKFQNEVETKENGGMFSFININIYWDLIENFRVLFGPFVSMNYLYLNLSTGINMRDYIFSGGLRFSYKLKNIRYPRNYNYQIIGSEIGYRNIKGENKFYFSINADIVLAIIGIATANRMRYSPRNR